MKYAAYESQDSADHSDKLFFEKQGWVQSSFHTLSIGVEFRYI